MQVQELKLIETYQTGLRNFQSIVEKIDNKKTYEKALRLANKKYDIKNFKVLNMTPVKARKIYPSLQQKYSQNSTGQESWLQNQRRLYIWLVLCYLFISDKSITDLTMDDFSIFSSIFNHKKQEFLKFQIFAITKKQKKQSRWTVEEDDFLQKILSLQKFEVKEIQWNEVSKQFFRISGHNLYRSPKQCKERWMNHLDPNKIKGSWSHEQDLVLLKFVKQRGKKWSLIAKDLDGCKTEHMVKNRYNSLIHKKGKQISSKKQQKILNKLIEELQPPISKSIEEQFKTSSREGQSFISSKSDHFKSQRNEEFPNIFENDSSLVIAKKCKFFVQKAGSFSFSERGFLPQLANPILEEMDSQEQRSRIKFPISTPRSERGGQMKSPYLMLSPLITGNCDNMTPSMFFLEQNGRGNNGLYASDFNLSFSSNFDKFVPEQ